jgi:hypothetical protein
MIAQRQSVLAQLTMTPRQILVYHLVQEAITKAFMLIRVYLVSLLA